jgi:hypothetical protein
MFFSIITVLFACCSAIKRARGTSLQDTVARRCKTLQDAARRIWRGLPRRRLEKCGPAVSSLPSTVDPSRRQGKRVAPFYVKSRTLDNSISDLPKHPLTSAGHNPPPEKHVDSLQSQAAYSPTHVRLSTPSIHLRMHERAVQAFDSLSTRKCT